MCFYFLRLITAKHLAALGSRSIVFGRKVDSFRIFVFVL